MGEMNPIYEVWLTEDRKWLIQVKDILKTFSKLYNRAVAKKDSNQRILKEITQSLTEEVEALDVRTSSSGILARHIRFVIKRPEAAGGRPGDATEDVANALSEDLRPKPRTNVHYRWKDKPR
jgi:hypothetical protein